MASEAIRTDPEWKGSDYTAQPRGLRLAAEVLQLMGSSPAVRQRQGPTSKEADAVFEKELAGLLARLDATDTLYAVESSRDYDPGPGLEKIRVPLLAINFADDLINPPELGILEREIKRVKKGQAITIPASNETVGHGTHTKAAVWKKHLEKLMKETEAERNVLIQKRCARRSHRPDQSGVDKSPPAAGTLPAIRLTSTGSASLEWSSVRAANGPKPQSRSRSPGCRWPVGILWYKQPDRLRTAADCLPAGNAAAGAADTQPGRPSTGCSVPPSTRPGHRVAAVQALGSRLVWLGTR